MQTLQGDLVYLRALEPTDLDFLYDLENDENVWEISNTATPFSKFILKQYLKNSHRDIYEVKQLRLVICTKASGKPVGLIDLYNFDPKHLRVGVGIIIFNSDNRGKGFATEALKLIHNYVGKHLKAHQLYASITADNKKSISLFEKAGYHKTGVKKDWILSGETYKDELFYQLLLK
jgi:diamine N-acetyltransferase